MIPVKQVRRALQPQRGGFLNTFTHTLQPYAGCAFGQATSQGQGCPYCYVRRLPVALFAASPWGEWVVAKENIADVLRREMHRLAKRGMLPTLRIFMSSATDPYQGAETGLRLTRACLEVFAEYPPALLVVQTRSPLVVRDVDVLQRIPGAWVSLTLETNEELVRRAFTPTSPTVASRLDAMQQLLQAGIPVQAAVSPMLPNTPDVFARLLKHRCTRAVVDTLFHGDGAHGRRSEALGLRALFERLGYAEWYHRSAHLPLLRALESELGAHRVQFSQAGFNAIGDEGDAFARS
ncbi:SPL family radical SAM protein [Alicyclobacillus contaminans]|uniref:SPL family radical SAM protein n=1 Tax=Alicyclobacillus contaminans TaxID=392016 RepID=UPI0009FC5F5A|nr:radical SAM protein [Alicyclobacillus contaminans]